jgi:hypothetical protein
MGLLRSERLGCLALGATYPPRYFWDSLIGHRLIRLSIPYVLLDAVYQPFSPLNYFEGSSQ